MTTAKAHIPPRGEDLRVSTRATGPGGPSPMRDDGHADPSPPARAQPPHPLDGHDDAMRSRRREPVRSRWSIAASTVDRDRPVAAAMAERDVTPSAMAERTAANGVPVADD